MASCLKLWFWSHSVLVVAAWLVAVTVAGNVTYDHGAIIIDGKPRVLISGSIHYPRSTPEMWPDLIAKAKNGGVDVIQTYVFWNMHEPTEGTYNFEGKLDLVYFIQLIQQAGLYASLRIGPYICAEWNYGGFPVWLHSVPGIAFRTDNEPFKERMQNFTSKIVQMMKDKGLFYSQGGPIILSQIENEYGVVDGYYGDPGKSYMNWAAQMAVGLDTGVPWMMCKQPDAPDPIINTWNGFYCDAFQPNSAKKPKMCTEAWTGWFQSFGGLRPHRPVEDLAFAVARFIELGGSFMNYYMYHGGTNFGRTAGGPFITTSYDYDAPLDEYGNLRQPKWGHLKDLHAAIKLCEPALVLQNAERFTFGPNQEGHIYTDGGDNCAAFLANYDSQMSMTVVYNNRSYHLPAWSVSILPDCKHVIYNTGKVIAQTSLMTMKPTSRIELKVYENHMSSASNLVLANSGWEFYEEPIGSWNINHPNSVYFNEQINTTMDTTDYLWYITSVGNEQIYSTTLEVESQGHALHAFVNRKLIGGGHGTNGHPKFAFETPIKLEKGYNEFAILSVTVGLQNVGGYFENRGAGIKSVRLKDQAGGIWDLSSQTWQYQVGLSGEILGLFLTEKANSSLWQSNTQVPKNSQMIWYKTTFDEPMGTDPLVLDLISMGKGQAWINDESIGRYWPSYIAPHEGCSNSCDYRGPYNEFKCTSHCGRPSQRWYHVPRSWLRPTGNVLVLFEEIGGDPTRISVATSVTATVCARVSEKSYPPVDTWTPGGFSGKPQIRLSCGQGHMISGIQFASFGNPKGKCGKFEQGNCHAPNSMILLRQACAGREECSFDVSTDSFGQDPCPGVAKVLAVEVECSEIRNLQTSWNRG